MRAPDPGSDSYRSRIIDVEANQPPDTADAREADARDSQPRLGGQSFRERHALKVMGVVMVAMFATVIVAELGC